MKMIFNRINHRRDGVKTGVEYGMIVQGLSANDNHIKLYVKIKEFLIV